MTAIRYFAIFGVMRTGSNLLERSLDHYEGLVGLGELFNQHFIGGPKELEAFGTTLAERNLDPVGFLERVIAAHPGQIPGFRIFRGHDARMMAHAARDPQCAKFVLHRDPLDSFLSLKIAGETGQWMLRKEGNRKLAKVRFDSGEFAAYRDDLARHYDQVRTMIRAAGQAAFEIAYEDLQSNDIMNGAARFAGSSEVKDRLSPRIQRQNPESAAEKVENPADLPVTGSARRMTPAAPRPRFAALDALIVSRGIEVVFAPVPGAGAEAITAMLEAAEAGIGRNDKPMVTGLKPGQLERRRGRGGFVFSFVRDPAARIWEVYQGRILHGADPAFDDARRVMIRDYGAPSVPAMQTDPAARAAGFDAFLSFVADNMAGRTAAPQDPAWAPQSLLIAAYAEETPPDFVGRLERAEADLGYVLGRLNVPDDGRLAASVVSALAARMTVPLADVMTPARAARIHEIYARDYRRLGYPPPVRS